MKAAFQSKILFYNEGNPRALLVSNKAWRHSTRNLNLTTAEEALKWCRKNRVSLYYIPGRLEGN